MSNEPTLPCSIRNNKNNKKKDIKGIENTLSSLLYNMFDSNSST